MTNPGYRRLPGVPRPARPPTRPPPPPGYANSDEKTWALVAHFGGAAGNLFCGFLGFVAPLIALLAKGPSHRSCGGTRWTR